VSRESIARRVKDWSGTVKKRLTAESVFCVADVEESYGCGTALAGDMLVNILQRDISPTEVSGREKTSKELPTLPLLDNDQGRILISSLLMKL
jgi:hypothetical protein